MGGDVEAAGGAPAPAGCRVLVVEDDFLIALELAEALRELGCGVLGPAASAERALALLRGAGARPPDAALLDAKLLDGGAGPVLAALAAAGVPFGAVTGYDRAALEPEALRAAPYLGKPYGPAELRAFLRRLLPGRRVGR
jgi:DNA-binding response OmpR family regulator